MPTKRVLKLKPTVDPEEVDRQQAVASGQRLVSPEDIQSGRYLYKMAKENMQTMSAMSNRPTGGSVNLTWASACSGSEGPRFVAETLNACYKEVGIDCHLNHLFSCEAAEEKRKWIHRVNRSVCCCMQMLGCLGETTGHDAGYMDMLDMPCIFRDIQHLDRERAACWEHNGLCQVPSCDLFIAGTSCKDMSRANPGPSRGDLVLQQQASKGGSAQTFQGLLSFLDTKQPAMLLFENVDSMEDAKVGGASNMDVLKSEMSSRGYEGQVVRTDAFEFGLPCHRRRIFALFVRVVGCPLFTWTNRPFDVVFQTFRGLLAGCLHTSPCVSQVLLPRDHDAVLAELKERQARHAKAVEQKAAKAAEAEGQVSLGENWVEQHMKYAEAKGLQMALPTPPQLQRSPWFSVLTEREKNALLICRAEKHLVVFRDLSQSIARINSNSLNENTGQHVCPTLLPKMELWIDNFTGSSSRLLLGQEALMLQGFPVQVFLAALERHDDDEWRPTQSLMLDLAGNAMPLPTVLAMLQAGFCALNWRPGVQGGEACGPKAKEKELLLYMRGRW